MLSVFADIEAQSCGSADPGFDILTGSQITTNLQCHASRQPFKRSEVTATFADGDYGRIEGLVKA